jgi:hypothetical protein
MADMMAYRAFAGTVLWRNRPVRETRTYAVMEEVAHQPAGTWGLMLRLFVAARCARSLKTALPGPDHNCAHHQPTECAMSLFKTVLTVFVAVLAALLVLASAQNHPGLALVPARWAATLKWTAKPYPNGETICRHAARVMIA